MNISVYSNNNSSTRYITFDVMGDVLAPNDATPFTSNSVCSNFYIKITTSATQDNYGAYPVKIVRSLSELALNGQVQSASNTGADYADIRSMVVDYVYDFINGHTADQFLSGCSRQRPMKF